MDKSESGLAYDPTVFNVHSLDEAKHVILNPVPDMSTDERWEAETCNLVNLFGQLMPLDAGCCVLDYGCGVGRLAKGLIERYGCRVVGIDISASMRQFALEYVGSERFSVCSPEDLDQMVDAGFMATHACACWVLQHCARPNDDLNRIQSALADRAWIVVCNGNIRWVPTSRGWVDDGISVEELLAARFDLVSKLDDPHAFISPLIRSQCWLMLLRKRASSLASGKASVAIG